MKGGVDTDNLSRGNLVLALCDVDRRTLAAKAKQLEAHGQTDIKLYTDYRKLFDEVKGLDAVSVTTPDHHHAPAALHALTRGIATYVQKPLAHTVAEVRLMRKIAGEKNLATQMGNQGTANDCLRECVEMVQSGAIGKVSECHVWTNRPTGVWPQGLERPKGEDKVPDWLDWECFIGPAPMRPYVPDVYNPVKWRGWFDFGCGALGDMACHMMNMPFWALKLGYPSAFQRVEADKLYPETFPNWSTLKYEFPAREDLPACTLFWYDGSRVEDVKGADGTVVRKRVRNYPPRDKFPDGKVPDTGSLLIGEKGVLLATGDTCDAWKLMPEADFKDYQKPKPWLPRARPSGELGHVREFVNAVKGGPAPMSNFEYSGRLTEVVLAGCLCMHSDKRIEWDGPNMKATNAPELSAFIDKAYRTGWELPGR
jgi:predicted dehydrogenase